jgi:hypothetical protein
LAGKYRIDCENQRDYSSFGCILIWRHGSLEVKQ